MSQIILDYNLKFILSILSTEQKGRLLTSLLEENETTVDADIKSIYTYIMKLQEEIRAKKNHMREIGSKGGLGKNKNTIPDEKTNYSTEDNKPTPNNAKATLEQSLNKRKETKENNLNNIYNKKIKNILLHPSNKSVSNINNPENKEPNFIPPTISEVNQFITKENINISAETFVNFYTSRDWCMGNIKISNWQAVAKLWGQRSNLYNKNPKTENKPQNDDEKYWHQLSEKAYIIELENTSSTKNNDSKENTSAIQNSKALPQTNEKEETNLLTGKKKTLTNKTTPPNNLTTTSQQTEFELREGETLKSLGENKKTNEETLSLTNKNSHQGFRSLKEIDILHQDLSPFNRFIKRTENEINLKENINE